MANKKITELPAATTPIVAGVKFEAVQGGVNVQVDASDMPGSGGGSGIVETIVAGTNITVDDTDPANPIVSASGAAAPDWGDIGGTLANQTDLQSSLNLKLDSLVSFRTETASHTLDATDLASINAGDNLKIKMNVASANNLTIPLNATQAFPTGTVITIHQIGAGQTTIVATGGVTINSENGWTKIQGQYASVVITKTATDTWDLEGTLTS